MMRMPTYHRSPVASVAICCFHGSRGASVKQLAFIVLALAGTSPAFAQTWHIEGPIFEAQNGGTFCLSVSPEDLGVRLNAAGADYDIAFFKVPVSKLTLLNLNNLAQKDVWALIKVDESYTAYIKATLGPLARNDGGTPMVDVFLLSSDFHLYEEIKGGTSLRAIVGEGFQFDTNLDNVPGTIITYSLSGSSGAIGSAEDCMKETKFEAPD